MVNFFATINAYILYGIYLVGVNKKTEEFYPWGILLFGLYSLILGGMLIVAICAIVVFIFYFPLYIFLYE